MKLRDFVDSLEGEARRALMALRAEVTDKDMESECHGALRCFVEHAADMAKLLEDEPDNAEPAFLMHLINGVQKGETFTLGFVIITSDNKEQRIPIMLDVGVSQDHMMNALTRVLDGFKGQQPMLKAVVQIASSVCIVGSDKDDIGEKNAAAKAALKKGDDPGKRLSCSVVMIDGRMGTLLVEQDDDGLPTDMRWMSEEAGMTCTQLTPADDLVMRYLATRISMQTDISTDGWTKDGWKPSSSNTETETDTEN